MKGRLQIARGAQAVERVLLEQVGARIERATREPAELSLPLRVVVPSRSLRSHLQCELVRSFGALAGVRVQTLSLLALEIVERSGAAPPRGELLVPILVRRLAAAEPALRARLHDLRDGYGAVAGAVSDLLDAGFEAVHAEAAEEALAETLGSGEETARARAVLRVAAGVSTALARAGLAHRSELFRSAREALSVAAPEGLVTAGAIWVHGFSDATGVQAELLELLVRRCGAWVLLDRPPDPAQPGRDLGSAFGDRFAARMQGAAAEVEAREDPGGLPRVEALHAPGLQAEVRAVAGRIRSLLDAGACPERVAVVARRLDPYRAPLRTHLRRLGVPFSGVGAHGPPGPERRRLVLLLGLLEQRERTPTERWLDALERLPGEGDGGGATPLSPGLRADLLLALHGLGASRIDEVARLRPAENAEALRLPVRSGLVAGAGEGEAGGGEVWAPHRRLDADRLAAAVRAADALCVRLSRWPARAPLGRHVEELLGLAREDLGWGDDAPGARALGEALRESDLAAPREFELEAGELPLFAERCLAGAAVEEVGGHGGGVQVLDVMEARARTFDHLFLVGLNRDVFPRTVTEDPLIPDRVRRRLRVVLPDLPVKAEGTDEERHLFAQLLASAPRITLSCALSDDDGKARPVSPLLDRLRWAEHVGTPQNVPSLLARRSLAEDTGPRPAHEHATLAGLYGGRKRFGAALRAALDERVRERGGAVGGLAPLAEARLAVLCELDPTGARRRELGPYFGFLGSPREPADPRAGDLAITAVESVARCPWQTFLRRLLRVEPVPDPHAALPAAGDARLLGILVHDVLDAVVKRAAPERSHDLAEALACEPVAVPWPDEAALAALVRERAEALVLREGIGLPGFARVLALHALDRVRIAGGEAWPDGSDGALVVGAELNGSAGVGSRRLRFRADRVDRVGAKLRIVDYKSGRPFSRHKTASARGEKLLERVRNGKQLQTVAYARAGRELGVEEVEGRYLYLDPADRWPARAFDVRAGDASFEEAFDLSVGAILAAWDEGCFVPRLADAESEEEPHTCEGCEVKEACLRGDSGARQRLFRWSRDATQTPERCGAERALLGVWTLGGGS